MNEHPGVFETMRTYHQKIFELPAHLRRLRASARIAHIPIHFTNNQLAEWLTAYCRPNGETRLKLVVTTHSITIKAVPLRVFKKIYRGVAITAHRLRRYQPTVKSIARQQEDHVYTQAVARGYFDTLLLNQRNQVLETSRGNLFYVKNNVLYTPNKDILFGITRAVVLKLARRRFRTRYQQPTLRTLLEADECFMTRSSVGIVPIVRVNKKKIGKGKPGPVTKQLMVLFNRYANR